jgi:hypothetical protein
MCDLKLKDIELWNVDKMNKLDSFIAETIIEESHFTSINRVEMKNQEKV